MLVVLFRHRLPLVVDAAALRTRHSFGHVTKKLLEARHTRGAEVRTRYCGVHVDVRHRARQLLRVLLGPFGGTEQAFFLSIPAGENYRALRFPSALQQLTDAMNRLQLCSGAAVGI